MFNQEFTDTMIRPVASASEVTTVWRNRNSIIPIDNKPWKETPASDPIRQKPPRQNPRTVNTE